MHHAPGRVTAPWVTSMLMVSVGPVSLLCLTALPVILTLSSAPPVLMVTICRRLIPVLPVPLGVRPAAVPIPVQLVKGGITWMVCQCPVLHVPLHVRSALPVPLFAQPVLLAMTTLRKFITVSELLGLLSLLCLSRIRGSVCPCCLISSNRLFLRLLILLLLMVRCLKLFLFCRDRLRSKEL